MRIENEANHSAAMKTQLTIWKTADNALTTSKMVGYGSVDRQLLWHRLLICQKFTEQPKQLVVHEDEACAVEWTMNMEINLTFCTFTIIHS